MSALSLSAAERSRIEAAEPGARASVLAVFTGVPGTGPAIAGSYALDAEGLHFRPLFPFVSGVRYTARLELGHGAPLVHHFEVKLPAGEPPRVTAVFPSGDELPENTLRVYLHFSRAMQLRDAQSHVHLFDAAGHEVPLAFVEIAHGLWDPGRTRLTLLFHPGRIKRGVAPGEQLGPPLRAGHGYRLVVDAAMRDAAGQPLGRDFERQVRVTDADRESPQVDGLRVEPPPEMAAPLVVGLPEPLDEALLHRLIWVEHADGQPVAGAAAVSEGETRWSFRPERPWAPGRYAVRVHTALEDRAGNRFDRVFDREDAARAAGTTDAQPLRLEFEIGKRPGLD